MLISSAVTALLICVFVFAYENRFSHDAAHFVQARKVVFMASQHTNDALANRLGIFNQTPNYFQAVHGMFKNI